MAKVVITRPTHYVASDAVVVFIAAHTHAVFNGGDQAFMFHCQFLLSRANLPFVDAALDQIFIIFTKTKQTKQSLKHAENLHFNKLLAEFFKHLQIDLFK